MLELSGLKKRFGDVIALDDCSFTVQPGRVLGFLGRNGAGKTTAMRTIFGLVYPDAGSVRWQGGPVTRESRLGFGYMPEERGLYPRMRIGDQLVYFGRLRGLEPPDAQLEADLWLERLGLGDRKAATLDSLSHGNQQRVQLAVSLVGQPSLLVLDEPFSGLDPIAADTLTEVIRTEAQRGAAVVFSSHQLDLVEGVCDDIAVITRGRVVLTGGLDEVRGRSPYRYVDVSFESAIEAPEAAAVARRMEGATVEPTRARAFRFRVATGVDARDVLSTIASLGEIESLRFEPPSLADIFREAVGE